MKRVLAAMLAFLCILGLVGCGNDIAEENGQSYFNAEVLSADEENLMVTVTEGFNSGMNEGSAVSMSRTVISKKGMPDVKKGDQIRVVFNGAVMESYPLQLGTVFTVYRLDENGSVIVE